MMYKTEMQMQIEAEIKEWNDNSGAETDAEYAKYYRSNYETEYLEWYEGLTESASIDVEVDRDKFIDIYPLETKAIYCDVTVRSTSYDSCNAYCYDVIEFVGRYKTIAESITAVMAYIYDNNLDDYANLSDNYSYGHKFEIKKVSQEEAELELSKAKLEYDLLVDLVG